MAESQWKIVVEPEGKNPGPIAKAVSAVTSGDNGKNQGGMVIYLTNGSTAKQEVSRVGWVRRNTKNPKNSFEKQLKLEMQKARTAVEMLNNQFTSSGELV